MSFGTRFILFVILSLLFSWPSLILEAVEEQAVWLISFSSWAILILAIPLYRKFKQSGDS